MRILTLNNIEEVASQTEVLMRELFNKKKEVIRGFFPTGKSADSFYSRLRSDQFWRRKFLGLQIDEFAQNGNLFLSQLQKQLIWPLQLEEQFETIDPSWSDSEMQKHIERVTSLPIDFALLGLGPNGHIGFHEPDIGDESFAGGRVRLTELSMKRVTGAATDSALTFGAGSFLKARRIIMLVVGAEKEPVYREFLESEPSSRIPATLLKGHGDFTVLKLRG